MAVLRRKQALKLDDFVAHLISALSISTDKRVEVDVSASTQRTASQEFNIKRTYSFPGYLCEDYAQADTKEEADEAITFRNNLDYLMYRLKVKSEELEGWRCEKVDYQTSTLYSTQTNGRVAIQRIIQPLTEEEIRAIRAERQRRLRHD